MSAERIIRNLIHSKGKITFAQFMDIAMFSPESGYYNSSDIWGVQGDYYTSPMAHPCFGAMLSIQLFQMWALLNKPDPFYVVELGCGNAILGKSILSYSRNFSTRFANSLQYIFIDRLTRSAPGSGDNFQYIESDGMPISNLTGCFLSNELLDSFPVHRVTVRNGELKEMYVAQRDNELTEIIDNLSNPQLEQRFTDLNIKLAENQIAEVNLSVESWLKAISHALNKGFILTIDYGDLSEHLYSPDIRFHGSLTTYYKHTQTDNPFSRIGYQDITAQVDFTSLMQMGTKVGLNPYFYGTQKRLLDNLGHEMFMKKLVDSHLDRRTTTNNRFGFNSLVDMNGLGKFKVLIQGKDVGEPHIWASEPDSQLLSLLSNLPFPFIEEGHMSLLDGRYPEHYADVCIDDIWRDIIGPNH